MKDRESPVQLQSYVTKYWTHALKSAAKIHYQVSRSLRSKSSSLSSPSLAGFHLAIFLTLPLRETPGVAECRFL